MVHCGKEKPSISLRKQTAKIGRKAPHGMMSVWISNGDQHTLLEEPCLQYCGMRNKTRVQRSRVLFFGRIIYSRLIGSRSCERNYYSRTGRVEGNTAIDGLHLAREVMTIYGDELPWACIVQRGGVESWQLLSERSTVTTILTNTHHGYPPGPQC